MEVVTQSGRATDYTRVTLNLNVEPKLGSLAGARCVWDFKDGTSSEKCNPPSHTWDTYGVYDIDLLVTTACGDSIRKSHEVVVLQKTNTNGVQFHRQNPPVFPLQNYHLNL